MWTLLLVITLSSEAWTQSNYASQGNSIEYQPGLPPSTILDGKVTKLDELSPIIFLNRTKAYLNCSQGSMQVELKFDEPFYGVAYADFDRNSACMVKGRGFNYAELELPLKGCGTKQDPQRVFTNNIVVRFHPGLEMDGDEVITIICRYPPPITPKPSIAQQVLPPIPAEGGVPEPPLKGFQILLTICALLFLSLLLLGLGCSYLCLKRRNIRVVHRHPFGSATGSEITKLSGSSLGHLSMFEGLKIPRAHTLLHTAASSSGSEANLVIDHSDTLPSDYPSESHSEVGMETTNAYGFDEIIHSTRSTTSLTPGLSQIDEVRSLPPSSMDSYDNKAYIHDHQNIHASSLYSETMTDIDSTRATTATSRITTRHPIAGSVEPKFDVQMRVKRAPPPPSPLPSESDASIALERNLTTILEREETIRSMESPTPRMTTFSYVPELHSPPSSMISRQQTPPVYSRILRKQAERENHEIINGSTVQQGSPATTLHRPRSLTTLEEYTETRTMTEMTDASHAKYRVASILAPTPPPPPPIVPTTTTHTSTSIQQREHIREEVEPLVEPVVAPRRPEITTHEVDDVFLRTVTEKKTIEDVERHKRQVTEYYARKPDPKWDVTIRNYPADEIPPAPPQWENFSDVSSASNLTIINDHIHMRSADEVDSTIEPTYSRAEMPSRSPHGLDSESMGDQWETLSRVLEPQYAGELTDDEREKWREVITTESTLRTLLSEAVVKEDYELIRKDARYQTLFPPAKWDVIIRILSPPPASSIASSKSGQKYKRSKGSEWDSRSRRSSLPTLYEYDSDGGTSIRTHDVPGAPSEDRARRLSTMTRTGSEVDLRSESETIRNFKMQRDDVSVSSYEADSIVRSLSQPSLARSSEFAEHWGLPARNLRTWAPEPEDIASSPDTTPMAIRRGDRVEVMTSFDSGNHPGPGGLTSTFTRSTRYSERETVRVTEAPRHSGWFHDDSEPEMQI
ncbi:uncharacterized protein LOC103570101 [Microplitis demolitor]|uniref:uncharacterized protein LOC103570101 n=1 Tax=Microplitis demolitor TaxID=69319 RepID=UPI0004CD1D7F|nr:uncharacterized protein LOC103570101 [Microplitis demolitor]XP_008545930.1 uncharacterized protein LOC103570101 [Microplitis demolitor]